MRGKWTPGPWSVLDQRDLCDELWITVEHPEAGTVSFAAVRDGCDEASELGDFCANARLIAAAPALYEALETACQIIADLSDFANNNGAMIEDETFPEGLAALSLAHTEPSQGEKP